MDQEKIGKFIFEMRKEKKLTQEELGEYLGISNRSISKWENGKSMPDISLFKPLCEILDISYNELLSGEKLNKDKYQKELENNLSNVINYASIKDNTFKNVLEMLIFISIILSLYFININNKMWIYLLILSIIIILYLIKKYILKFMYMIFNKIRRSNNLFSIIGIFISFITINVSIYMINNIFLTIISILLLIISIYKLVKNKKIIISILIIIIYTLLFISFDYINVRVNKNNSKLNINYKIK